MCKILAIMLQQNNHKCSYVVIHAYFEIFIKFRQITVVIYNNSTLIAPSFTQFSHYQPHKNL